MTLPAPIYETKYGVLWVLIGNLWWSVDNYSGTELADSTPIPEVQGSAEWVNVNGPAWRWYNNTTELEFQNKYGRKYNWACVEAGLKMPDPECRVPNLIDINNMVDYLIANGYNWDGSTTGNKIGKALASNGGEFTSRSTAGLIGNDQGSNNSSGFGGLPGGQVNVLGDSVLIGIAGYFWLSNQQSDTNAYAFILQDAREDLLVAETSKIRGFSLRLVRDVVTPEIEITAQSEPATSEINISQIVTAEINAQSEPATSELSIIAIPEIEITAISEPAQSDINISTIAIAEITAHSEPAQSEISISGITSVEITAISEPATSDINILVPGAIVLPPLNRRFTIKRDQRVFTIKRDQRVFTIR